MVCVDGMVREKHSIWYGTFAVWYHGTVSWMNYMAKICLVVWSVSVYKVRKGRIRRTNIICNELIYRPLESVRKYKPCRLTDRQTDRQICIYHNRDSVLLQTDNIITRSNYFEKLFFRATTINYYYYFSCHPTMCSMIFNMDQS